MGYYASSDAFLSLKEGVDLDAVQGVIESWEEGFELVDLTSDGVHLSFSAKYRGVEKDLAQLLPYVRTGEYMQFVGEDDSVWRLVFEAEGLAKKEASF